LDGTSGVTSIAVRGVLVVAHLTGTDHAITADNQSLARANRDIGWAFPIALDLACAVAPVARHGIAVVTLLNAALIVDAVTAAFG
jgi:hypothetical protein